MRISAPGKLALAVSLASLSQLTLVQSTLAAEIEEILVSSQRLEESIPQDLSRYGNRVEIVTAAEIAEHGFVDITQTLQMLVPGLHISPKNGWIPASASFKKPIICSSENRFFTSNLLV